MRTHPISQAGSNEEALEGLVERTLLGDERAWHELLARARPDRGEPRSALAGGGPPFAMPRRAARHRRPRDGGAARGRFPAPRGASRAARVPGRIVPAVALEACARREHRPRAGAAGVHGQGGPELGALRAAPRGAHGRPSRAVPAARGPPHLRLLRRRARIRRSATRSLAGCEATTSPRSPPRSGRVWAPKRRSAWSDPEWSAFGPGLQIGAPGEGAAARKSTAAPDASTESAGSGGRVENRLRVAAGFAPAGVP